MTGLTIPSATTFLGNRKDKFIEADCVILATGAQIQTSYAPPSLLNPDGSVKVNPYLQTRDTNIYAAGDIASFFSLLSEK